MKFLKFFVLFAAFSGFSSLSAAENDSNNENLATIVNRAELDIKAPASFIWEYLPGIRRAENIDYKFLNPLRDQVGAHFFSIVKDSEGNIIKNDEIEVLTWEPGERFVARIIYHPPMPKMDIIYSVDMKKNSDGSTHFVMDSYSVGQHPDTKMDIEERIETKLLLQQQAQETVEKGYQALGKRIEKEYSEM